MNAYDNNNIKTNCISSNSTKIYSKSLKPTTYCAPLIAKIPVLLSHTEIQLHIESRLKLLSLSTSITDIKIDIRISSCRLLDLKNKRNGEIYLKGYVHESVEYSELDETYKEKETGKIKNMIVDIPFECSFKVDYIVSPIFKTKEDKLMHVEVENLYCKDKNKILYTNNPTSLEGLSFELEDVKMIDTAITTEMPSDNKQSAFDIIIQDIIVNIRFSLMQKQLVRISGYSSYTW